MWERRVGGLGVYGVLNVNLCLYSFHLLGIILFFISIKEISEIFFVVPCKTIEIKVCLSQMILTQ